MKNITLYKAGLVNNVAKHPDYPVEPLDFLRLKKYYAGWNINLTLASKRGSVQGITKQCKNPKCMLLAPVETFKFERKLYTYRYNKITSTTKNLGNYCKPCFTEMNTGVCTSCKKTKGPGNWLRKNGTRYLRCAACIAEKGLQKQKRCKTYIKQG